MKKYFVVDGESTIFHTEVESLENAKMELLEVYERLNKHQVKGLENADYILIIEITENEQVEDFEDDFEYNSLGYKIIDTISYKELV